MKLIDGNEYTTIDHRTVRVTKTASGTFYDRGTNRYFTPAGHCIAYYRGNDAIIEKNRSILGSDNPEADIVAEIMSDEIRARRTHELGDYALSMLIGKIHDETDAMDRLRRIYKRAVDLDFTMRDIWPK